MHRLHLLTVGRVKTPWIADGIDVYRQRLKHSCDFRETVIPPGDLTGEMERLTKALRKIDGRVIVLDHRGKTMTSEAFAQWISKKRDDGESLTFVIGGAYGLSDAVRSDADLLLSLGTMTLPHELCQLVFLEQLYRAHEIGRGSGYHH